MLSLVAQENATLLIRTLIQISPFLWSTMVLRIRNSYQEAKVPLKKVPQIGLVMNGIRIVMREVRKILNQTQSSSTNSLLPDWTICVMKYRQLIKLG